MNLTLVLASSIVATAPAAPGAGVNPITQIMPIILMFVIFYFILIRPQRKRQKELAEQVAALKSGDKVITSGGLHGLVTNVKERTVILKVADNTKMEFEKIAIQTITKKSDRSPEDDAGDSEPETSA